MIMDGITFNQALPEEAYVPDGQFEEERIMAERAEEPRAFDASALRLPVSVLDLRLPVTVGPEATISEAVEVMQHGRFGCVLVVDEAADGALVGIFTERDVLTKIAGKGIAWKRATIEPYMTTNPETLGRDANLAFCMNMMTVGGYRHVPIVDLNERPVGVVSVKDIVRYICGFFEKEVVNLPPRPNLLHPTKREDG